MSVGGGHFSNKSAYTYISGAPRSKMKGQVYFFEKYNNEELNISLIITGEQFASSFGYELLATDVNNDGYVVQIYFISFCIFFLITHAQQGVTMLVLHDNWHS